jgi:hypothetical protein
MIALTEKIPELINNALANGCPCILATASKDGDPDIGYKGSMMVLDNESLAYWERTMRQHLKNVQGNPKVVVLFIKEELDKDPERKGSAVVIRVDKVTNRAGQVLQSR